MKSGIRLWIEYIMLAALLGVIGLAVTLKMQTYRQTISINNLSTGLEKAQGDIATLSSVNEAQDGIIENLSGQRATDNAAVDRLLSAYDKLRDADQKIRSKLDDLEKTDVNVQTYFSVSIPESVACVYDDSCGEAKGSSPNKDNKTVSPIGNATPLLLAPEEKARNSKGGYGPIPKVEGGGNKVLNGNGRTD